MIVHNEEAALPRCLDSVAGLADEIVIVDTGSTDATVAMATGYEAAVLHHDFSPIDYAAARNLGLDRATGDHVLVLDADETLDPASGPLVRALATGDEDVGYVVTRRNLPREAARAPWLDHAVRLFRRDPRFRFAGRVHETIDRSILAAGGRLQRADIVLNHHLPPEPQAREKGLRYLELLRVEASDDPDRLVFLAAELHKLERYAEATRVAERVAELAPDDFTAQFTAALYHHFYAGDPARADRDLDAALGLRPDDPEALALRTEIRGAAERLQTPQTHASHADPSGEC
jgi:glycosyltransferase involved in cell wall biosynthesis